MYFYWSHPYSRWLIIESTIVLSECHWRGHFDQSFILNLLSVIIFFDGKWSTLAYLYQSIALKFMYDINICFAGNNASRFHHICTQNNYQTNACNDYITNQMKQIHFKFFLSAPIFFLLKNKTRGSNLYLVHQRWWKIISRTFLSSWIFVFAFSSVSVSWLLPSSNSKLFHLHSACFKFQILKDDPKNYDHLLISYSLKNQIRYRGNLGKSNDKTVDHNVVYDLSKFAVDDHFLQHFNEIPELYRALWV